MNIILIGYRCSGKSTVGALLAQRLGKTFLDTDQMVETRLGRSISSAVEELGWNFFRDMERLTVRELLGMNNLVVATGGGVAMDLENVANLKRHGWLIWLKAGADAVRERMQSDQRSDSMRPALADRDPLAEVETLLLQRSPCYERVSDCVVDTTGKRPEEVVDAIMTALPRTATTDRPPTGDLRYAG